MIINLGSISFNANIETGGGTPAWGTEMGQGEGYKFTFENTGDFMTALVYNRVDETKVSCPLGKGGNKADEYEFVIASLFDKIYVNGLHVQGEKFLLLVTKKLVGQYHVGRRTLKYTKDMSYNGVFYNKHCYQKMAEVLGLTDESSWFIYEIDVKNQDELHFTAGILDKDGAENFPDSATRKDRYLAVIQKEGEKLSSPVKKMLNLLSAPRQQIFYGAPGTGKSHKTKEMAQKYADTIRVTFHPDSDYASFVGTYKPTMQRVPICDEAGQSIRINEERVYKEQITYKFVKQAFLKAYVKAWRKMTEEEARPQFLVIEEINRGNCAQIFGDLFQLLDRNGNGYSEYPIEADEDLAKSLLDADSDKNPSFGPDGLTLSEALKAEIKAQYEGSADDVAEKIRTGQVLVLPPNLYIWATMNTSDQSLFPIDSAFKRRWEWKYMRITDHPEMGWRIKFDYDGGTEDTDWWTFLQAINSLIRMATRSEDKQLGYFFCRASGEGKAISAETFVGKVIFYLWNDVFKNSPRKSDIFKIDGQEVTYDGFYQAATGNDAEGIDKLKVHNFIAHVIAKAAQ